MIAFFQTLRGKLILTYTTVTVLALLALEITILLVGFVFFRRVEHRHTIVSLRRDFRPFPAGPFLPAARCARSGRAARLAPSDLRCRVRQPAAAICVRQSGGSNRQERPDVRDLAGRDHPGGGPGQRKKSGGKEVQPAFERGPQSRHPRQRAADRTPIRRASRRSGRMETT